MISNVPSFHYHISDHIQPRSQVFSPSDALLNHDHPKGYFVINDHPETARAEEQIVPQANFFKDYGL